MEIIKSHFFVSVVSFLHNDADIVDQFIEETIHILKKHYQHFELILVDSDSSDDTNDKIAKFLKNHENVRNICLSRNFGDDIAISAGLDSAIGDVVVILDPQCDPPELIPDMVDKVRKTNGIVFGFKKPGQTFETLAYRLGKKIFNYLCKKTLKFVPPDGASFFIGLNRQALNAIIQMGSKSKFIRVFGAYCGYGNQTVPYTPIYRREKPKRRSLWEAIHYGIDIITNNSIDPLRWVSLLGIVVSGINFLYIMYIFLIFLFKKNVISGWVTSSLQVSGMFFVVFIVLTVLSRYIGVLLSEIKNNPIYLIKEEKNSSVVFNHEQKRNVMKESLDE